MAILKSGKQFDGDRKTDRWGDVLPDDQKLTLEIARMHPIRFLQQNAFHKDDTCVSMEKQFKMMEVILYLYQRAGNL